MDVASPSVPAARQVAIHETIRATWTRLTGSAPEPGVPFAEAGGDSLGLMETVFFLERALGVKLPLEQFHTDQTAEEIAERALAAIARTGDDPSLSRVAVFLCPAMHGDAPNLADFRRHCGDAVRFITIDYGAWPDCVVPGFGLHSLVDTVLAQIRLHQPTDAVRLAGFSAGARIAYETAVALEADGREVSFLGILDAGAPGEKGADMDPEGAPPDRLRAWWWTLHQLLKGRQDGTYHRRLGRLMAAPFVGTWVTPLLRRRARRPRRQRTRAELVSLWQWVAYYIGELRRLEAIRQADRAAKPVSRRLRAPTFLFRCAAWAKGASEDFGWRKQVETLSIVPIEGNHYNILTLHVASTAASFVAAFGAVDDSDGPSRSSPLA